jgi:hypothetical protein
MAIPIKELGGHLVRDSKSNEQFSAQRGLINQLFPYIYEASQRMSSRAISRWLETKDTKLSAATIAKALRNPQPYWREILDDIETAALVYAKAHRTDAMKILEDRALFTDLKKQPPILECSESDPDSLGNALEEYEDAYATIQEDWFSLPETSLKACLAEANIRGD